MCPFFDDIEKLTNFKYTLPCVTRIGKKVLPLVIFIFTEHFILYSIAKLKHNGTFLFQISDELLNFKIYQFQFINSYPVCKKLKSV